MRGNRRRFTGGGAGTRLSPRGRGNPQYRLVLCVGNGSIPAWAGEPQQSFRLPSPGAVYPRVGGGTLSRRTQPQCRFGLSPRGRGNPTQRYEGHAWCAATTHGRATCRGTASTPASASPSRRLSGGSGRRPTTSTPPSVWLIDTTNNLPQPWADRPGQRQVGNPSAISGLPRAW